jgi:alanine racemase
VETVKEKDQFASPRVDASDSSNRATRAVIDLDAIAGNVRVFRNLVTPSSKLMAVVKANGYGHGAVMIARTALKAGADQLAVATVDEGVQLRRADVREPILVLGPVSGGENSTAITIQLQLPVGTLDSIDLISDTARNLVLDEPVKVHLKIDTGMRRFGCMPKEVSALAQRIASDNQLKLAGIFTHFASADELDEHRTLDQKAEFDSVLNTLRAEGIDPGTPHAANSAAILRSRLYDYDMVRIGISLYGIAPSAEIGLVDGFNPAMSIRGKIGRVFELNPGDRVSYGGTYIATQREQAALIPIGYADGYRRGFSGNAWMSVDGVRCPVLGRVCMDQTVIGLRGEKVAGEGDEVAIAGDPEQGAPSFDDLAEIAGTIPYEIVTGINRRVPRFFMENGELVAIEDLNGLHELA